MLTWRKAGRAAGGTGFAFSDRIGRAAFAGALAAAVGGCTLSDSLIPPNPIPEARPADASAYSQNATPIRPSAGETRMAMAAPYPVSDPVQAGPLPPPATAG